MTIIIAALIVHVIVGLLGVAASYAVFMGLLKRTPPLRFLLASSFVAFISYLLSWLSGGYYYVVEYGREVEPVIKAGPYPWAHAFFTEVKEHVFLFLPFLSLVLFITLLYMGERSLTDYRLRRAVLLISLVTFLIGAYITVSGLVISGSVR